MDQHCFILYSYNARNFLKALGSFIHTFTHPSINPSVSIYWLSICFVKAKEWKEEHIRGRNKNRTEFGWSSQFSESPEYKNNLKILDNLLFNTRVIFIIKKHLGLESEVLAP